MFHRRGAGPFVALGVLLIASSCKDASPPKPGDGTPTATSPAPTLSAAAGTFKQPGTDNYIKTDDIRANKLELAKLDEYLSRHVRFRDDHESDHWFCDKKEKSCDGPAEFVNIKISASVDAKDLGPKEFDTHGYIIAHLRVAGRENIPVASPYKEWHDLTKGGGDLYWWVGPDAGGSNSDAQKRSSYMIVVNRDVRPNTVSVVPMYWAYWADEVMPDGSLQHGKFPGNAVPIQRHPSGALITIVKYGPGVIHASQGGDTGPWVRCGGGCCVGPPR